MQSSLNISSCDTEPIHLLGKIQSHGCLLAFKKKTFLLTHASTNAHSFFSDIPKLSFTHLQNIFGADFFKYVQDLCKKQFYNELYPHKVIVNNQSFRCYIADTEENIIVEIEEDINQGETEFVFINKFNEIASAIRNAPSFDVLSATVVHTMKQHFGFDRVMMYVFDELNDGLVVAEEKEFGLDSFLGLKYPAADIPKQARTLYLTNISRAVNDINDEGLAIDCFLPEVHELDLSYSVFRSVSPIHIQYLQNMGVTATHAISLVIQNKLWGMILFHNYNSPKYLDFNNHLLAQILAMNTAQAIELLEIKNGKENSNQIDNILEKIKFSDLISGVSDLITHNWLLISKQFKSCGFSILEDNTVIYSYADTPNKELLAQLHSHITKDGTKKKQQHSDKIKELLPFWKDDSIVGFLCLNIAYNLGKYIYIWRKAKIQTINWAGNPEKSMSVDETNNRVVLTPRSSFALWQQKVKDKSLPWLIQDLSFATTLNEAIINMEIKKNSELIIKNKELINKKSVLAVLLSQKTDELYKLNLQLQDELYDNQKYQRELEIAKKAGEQLNKMKSHFISNLSHEIRTPINGIIGLAQLIVQDHENAEEVQAFANLILDCSNRLSETVNRVLSVSRIENDAMPVQFENIEVIGFMKKLIKPLTILANQKAQNIIINSHSEELNMVSDKHYLGQIFTNLVSNAIKYTQEKGKIEINIKEVFQNNKSMFYFSVEDNGIGMERKVIDKIFDPFFTEKEVTKMSDNSVGLGLYLVKNYLQYLKGDITVKSEKGIGSLFYVTIPIE